MVKTNQQTILLVEDELFLLKALNNRLSKAGYRILLAKDGLAGLASALKNHPDIILLDIIMPKMDGLTMLKQLRAADSWGKRVPVIILTNLSDDKQIAEANAGNVYAYLIKTDWKLDELLAKIKKYLAA